MPSIISEKHKHEIKAYSISIRNLNLNERNSKRVADFISLLSGFLGVYPIPSNSILMLFNSKYAAQNAKKRITEIGIHAEKNICQCYVEKQYIDRQKSAEII